MDIIVPIVINDELFDAIIQSTAKLNLASGEITHLTYKDYDVKKHGIPAESENYEFTSGLLQFDGKELEFAINVEDGEYEVPPTELGEVREKIAKLSQAGQQKPSKGKAKAKV